MLKSTFNVVRGLACARDAGTIIIPLVLVCIILCVPVLMDWITLFNLVRGVFVTACVVFVGFLFYACIEEIFQKGSKLWWQETKKEWRDLRAAISGAGKRSFGRAYRHARHKLNGVSYPPVPLSRDKKWKIQNRARSRQSFRHGLKGFGTFLLTPNGLQVWFTLPAAVILAGENDQPILLVWVVMAVLYAACGLVMGAVWNDIDDRRHITEDQRYKVSFWSMQVPLWFTVLAATQGASGGMQAVTMFTGLIPAVLTVAFIYQCGEGEPWYRAIFKRD